MATPEERLTELAKHAKRVIERVNEEPGSTGCDIALSLAHAVLTAAESMAVVAASPTPFSFAIDPPPPEPKNVEPAPPKGA